LTEVRVVIAAVLIAFVAFELAADAKCARPMWLGTPAGTTVPPRGTMYRQTGERAEPRPYQAALGAFVVSAGSSELFIVDPAWKPPVDPPRVVAILRRKYKWTCSHTNAAAIQLDQPVAAVRVAWTYEGQSHETIVAPLPERTRNGVDLPSAWILLGYVSCTGQTMSTFALEAGVTVDMTAIRVDGSEVKVEGLPPILDFDDLPFEREKMAAL
jgi:hypothetical protein